MKNDTTLYYDLVEASEAPHARVPNASDTRVRMLKLAERLFTGGAVSVAWVCRHFGVSLATAKRDLVLLEQTLPVEASYEEGKEIHGTAQRCKLLRLLDDTEVSHG